MFYVEHLLWAGLGTASRAAGQARPQRSTKWRKRRRDLVYSVVRAPRLEGQGGLPIGSGFEGGQIRRFNLGTSVGVLSRPAPPLSLQLRV